MKKFSSVLIGVCSPLFYYIVRYFMLYCPLFEYNEKYAFLQNALFFILPALPGVTVALLLIRNTLKDFYKSLGICFFISLIIIILYQFMGIHLMVHTLITGYEEFGLGEGLLIFVTSFTYCVSCLVGSVIAGIVTLCRQKTTSNPKK